MKIELVEGRFAEEAVGSKSDVVDDTPDADSEAVMLSVWRGSHNRKDEDCEGKVLKIANLLPLSRVYKE